MPTGTGADNYQLRDGFCHKRFTFEPYNLLHIPIRRYSIMFTKSALFSTAMATTLFCASSVATAQSARDQISIVGSSTVFPFATVVAERFGQTTRFKTPKIESTGSGGGMKLFCNGVGVEHPDITNSSRRIKKGEFDSLSLIHISEPTRPY